MKICLGAVYAARAPNGTQVAIKVIELDRRGAGATLGEAYLNEVRHLERLRQQSHHVVRIYDFDFDMQSGRGNIHNLQIEFLSFIDFTSLYRDGVRWRKSIEIN